MRTKAPRNLFSDRKSDHNVVFDTGNNEKKMDGETIHELQTHGAHLQQQREILSYSYFPTRKAAEAAAEEFKRLGYAGEVKLSKDAVDNAENPWLVVSRKIGVVSEATIRAMRSQFTGTAEKFAGHFDGWEAAVEP